MAISSPSPILSILFIDVKQQSPSPGGRGAGGEGRTHPPVIARIFRSS